MKNVYEVIREKYGDFFESSLNMIYIIDLNGNLIDANDYILSILEYNKEEISNLSLKDLLDREQLLKALNITKRIEKGAVDLNPVEFKLKTKNGKFIYIECIGIPIKINGKINFILYIANNITKSKISEENYRLISENVNDLIAIVEIDYNFEFEYINEKLFLKLLGYKNKNLIGKSILDYIHPVDEKSFIKAFKKGIGIKKYPLELRIKSKENIYKYFKVKLKKIRREGNQEKLLVILSDLSKIKKLEEELEELNNNFKEFMNSTPEIRFWKLFTPKKYEEALKNSYEMLQMVMDNIPEYIFWKDTNLVYLGCNNNYADFIGAKSPENVVGKTDKDFIINKEKLKQLQEYETYIIKTDITVNRNIEQWKVNNEKIIWIDANRIILHDFERNNVGLLVTYRDISKEILAEQKLKESEENYRLISENANDLIAILDNKFRYEYINEEVHKKVLGYSNKDLIGKSALNKIHPEDLKDTLKNAFLAVDQGEGTVEVRFKKRNGNYIWLDVRGKRLKDHKGRVKGIIFSRDITERKNYDQKLKESEEKYRLISEHANDLIAIVNNKFKFEYVNSEVIRTLTERSADEIIGKLATEFVHPEDYNKAIKALSEGFKTGVGMEEIRIRHKNGSWLWMDVKGRVFIDSNGEKKALLIARDITERKIYDQKLKESEEKFRNLYEKSPNSIVLLNNRGIIIDYNPASEKLYGFKKYEIIGKNFFDLGIFSSEQISVIMQRYKEYSGGKKVKPIELQIKRKDGSLAWILAQSSLIEKGDERLIQGIAQDITEKKKSEQQLREAEEKYREVVNATFDGYFEVDLRGNFTYINKRICEYFGLSENDIIGMNFRKFVSPDDISKVFRIFNRLYTNKLPQLILEYKVLIRDGKRLFVEVIGHLKRDSEGKIVGFYGFTRDITERKEFQVKLENEVIIRTRELNESLSQHKLYLDQILKVSQFKTEFLSSMSHDLRTPLNSIIGFTEILLEGTCGLLNEDQKDYLNEIKLSSEDLLTMIDHILDISKIEAGQLTLTIRKFSLNTIVEQINSTIRPLYSKKGLQFEVQGLDNKEYIYADPIRFKEILYNLLSNAIKFTIKGNITLIIQDKSDYWLFKVKDTGIGIEEKDFEFIFKEFKRIDSTYVRSTPGSGLGLSLTKRLVELHKGEISFESIFGKGTIFTFTIPKDLEKEEEDIY